MHPRSRVRIVLRKLHTSIQGSGNTPALLRNGFTAYNALSLVNGLFATINSSEALASLELDAHHRDARTTRLRRTRAPRSSS